MSTFLEADVYGQLARLGKALASPVRLRLLDLLDGGERDVETLSQEAGVPLKNTSAQLQQLRSAHLVSTRRSGNHVYYRLADPEVSQFLGRFQRLAENRLADLRHAVADLLGAPETMQQVTADELDERLRASDTVVLDVRDRDEFERGHVPGAISIPADELPERLAELPASAAIVAYCQGPYCVLSPNAVQTLRRHGFTAFSLEGGLTRWHRGGGPVSPVTAPATTARPARES